MKNLLRHIFRNGKEPKALVLMYHRVVETDTDIWDIAVSPSNFEQQLQILQESDNVISLAELAKKVVQRNINKNYIAITFDDGYSDNYISAKPLLEKYDMPATFFITSSNVDKDDAFWWDELELLILHSKHLPSSFFMAIGEDSIEFDLLEDAQLTDEQSKVNAAWKACDEAPPSRRCALFLRLWQCLKPLPQEEQQQHLVKIRNWAGAVDPTPEALKSITAEQLKIMSNHKLFDIGAHTLSHPALASHSLGYQKQEILGSKSDLHAITGREISLLAYPYGNYNAETLKAAAETNFEAAFTTEEKLVTNKSNRYALARYQVKNWTGSEFNGYLQQWLSKSK
ncbi:polysaccharide deacetylase family protein [Pontibacter locisalis]|uniref:Polysaccharide deacetylase family protein n=1 Tax=Pontibacter locisalis TaxID=1719035 RepID=A0ABW5INH3_9BACT